MAETVAKALLAGVPLAIVAALLGSFIQWRRMAFFGDSLAHSALLGIGLSLLLGINHLVGVVAVLVLVAAYIHASEGSRVPSDTRLSVAANLSIAGGSLAIFLSGSRVQWEAILFGNILSLTRAEVAAMLAVAVAVGAAFAWLWPKLVLMAVNDEIATAELARMRLANIAFLLLFCAFVAVGVRLVGVLLLNALLIIPAAAARPLSASPAAMVALAAAIGAGCVAFGTWATFTVDVPMGPVTVLAAGAACAATWTWAALARKGS